MGSVALERMFADTVVDQKGIHRGRDARIDKDETTDPQAEVLVPGVIPPDLITTIVFAPEFDIEHWYLLARNSGRGPYPGWSKDSRVFECRRDYPMWLNPEVPASQEVDEYDSFGTSF